jgi:hypothetical protein
MQVGAEGVGAHASTKGPANFVRFVSFVVLPENSQTLRGRAS